MALSPLISTDECAQLVGVASSTYAINYASLADHPKPSFRYPMRYSRKEWFIWVASRNADALEGQTSESTGEELARA